MSKIKPERTLQGPQTCTTCKLYHLTICIASYFLQPNYSCRIVCSIHMRQCVAFDYFGVDCEGNFSCWPSCSVGARGMQGPHILRREFLGLKKYTLTTASRSCPVCSACVFVNLVIITYTALAGKVTYSVVSVCRSVPPFFHSIL